MTVADFVDLVVNEMALHGWDAFSTLDPDYRMAPESLPAALAIGNMTLARMASTGPARFRFDLTDGNDVPDLVVGGEAAPAAPSATLRCDGEALVLISSGRLGMEEAMESGRVEVSGDEGLVRELGRGLGGLYRGGEERLEYDINLMDSNSSAINYQKRGAPKLTDTNNVTSDDQYFDADRPIERRDEDRLGRRPFAEGIAQQILSVPASHGFTICCCW